MPRASSVNARSIASMQSPILRTFFTSGSVMSSIDILQISFRQSLDTESRCHLDSFLCSGAARPLFLVQRAEKALLFQLANHALVDEIVVFNLFFFAACGSKGDRGLHARSV